VGDFANSTQVHDWNPGIEPSGLFWTMPGRDDQVSVQPGSGRARFRARVASGTYMRSVAHDMGRELACGAHLESLRRTSVAEFKLEEAHTREQLAEATRTPEALDAFFIHPRKLLPQLPSVTADEATAARIRSGRTLNLPDLSRARQVKVFSGQRELIAIATRIAGTLFHPKIVIVSEPAASLPQTRLS